MSYQLGSADSDGRADLYAGPREHEARPRFRGLVASLVAFVVLAVFAGGLWFAYQQGLRRGGGSTGIADVPLIRAEERPTKVKPENPGGMEVPDRDKLIYTQKRATVEHLLPPPEKPMPRPTGPSAAAPSASPQPPLTTAAAGPANPAPQAQLQQPAGKLPAKAASVAGAAAKPAAAQQAGGARIQLASVRSEEAAHEEWDRIRRANPDLLGGVSATPVRADLGEKGVFYRLQTAPMADADRICGELKRRNIGCIIAR
ncbi:MAG: SPOR domain-containing protein [Alphaproteobacteria bacterium]|nr:SPOR domain-containing protein [Alphaproteobacteria bacterium]